MQIPNIDGSYRTRDGTIEIEVTRKTITVKSTKPKEKEFIIIDEEDRGGSTHKSSGSDIRKKLTTVGDGLSGLTYALIGDGKK